DAIKRDIPMWGFPLNARIEGDSVKLLQQLIAVIEQTASAEFKRKAQARGQALQQAHQSNQQRVAALAKTPGSVNAINPHHLCAALAQQIKPDDVILNEAIRNTMAVFEQIPRECLGH
ncbi:MAG: acetolactate synthase, partial [Betaproteobacteria bacterium]|nr:acetolactate synthase [Betaproteobacteria bacterium]